MASSFEFTLNDLSRCVDPCMGDSEWFFVYDFRDIQPLFDKYESNYEIETLFRDRGVLLSSNKTDTEYSSIFAYFPSQVEGGDFLIRVNEFLKAEYAKLPPGYFEEREANLKTFRRLQEKYGW